LRELSKDKVSSTDLKLRLYKNNIGGNETVCRKVLCTKSARCGKCVLSYVFNFQVVVSWAWWHNFEWVASRYTSHEIFIQVSSTISVDKLLHFLEKQNVRKRALPQMEH